MGQRDHSASSRPVTVTPFTSGTNVWSIIPSVSQSPASKPPFPLSNLTESVGPTVSPNGPSSRTGGVGSTTSAANTTGTESAYITVEPGTVPSTNPPFPLTNATLAPNPTAPAGGTATFGSGLPSSSFGSSQTLIPFPASNSTALLQSTATPSGASGQPITESQSIIGSTSTLGASETISPSSILNSAPYPLSNTTVFSGSSTSGSAGRPTVISTQSTFHVTVPLSTGVSGSTTQPLGSTLHPLSNSTLFSQPSTSPFSSSSGTLTVPPTGTESTGSIESPATLSGSASQSLPTSLSITGSNTAPYPLSNSTTLGGPTVPVPFPSSVSATEATPASTPPGQGIPPGITSSSILGPTTSAPYSDTCTEETTTTQELDTCTESETPVVTIDTTCSESTITESGSTNAVTFSSGILITSSVEAATGSPTSLPYSTTPCDESSILSVASSSTGVPFGNASFGGGYPTTFRTSTTVPISDHALNSTVVTTALTADVSSASSSSLLTDLPPPMPDRDHWHTPPAGPTPTGLVARSMTGIDAVSGWRQYVQNLFVSGSGGKEGADQSHDQEKA
ncbi:hypothetical protein AAE478_008540 [Parahypoxylon ruwenzoriense]